MSLKHAILVIHKHNYNGKLETFSDVVHGCGYEFEPEDWEVAKRDLMKELIEDPEFRLPDIIDNYVFVKADEKMIELLKEEI